MPDHNASQTTRRDFIKGAATTAGLLAMPATLFGGEARIGDTPPPPANEYPPDGPMKTHENSSVLARRELSADFVVVGGGMSGVCAAIAAVRRGASVILVQDRPVLGGNASSEIRTVIMGAHGNNNKETGLLEELQLLNIRRNPLMRHTLWDDILLTAVLNEKITLLLNTSVRAVGTENNAIKSVTAWNLHEYCEYTIRGRLFADCSGDSILRLSGAEFRAGREAASEFGEDLTSAAQSDTRTMGNSIVLQLRKCEEHRPFIAPEWARHFTDETIPKHRRMFPENNNFWWIEHGGMKDTIADAGAIQFELKRIAHGVWEYMKNHPDGRAKNYELDWIGALPGKRESARLVGDLLLTQKHIMDGGRFPDIVAHGGWTLDDHAPGGFDHAGDPTNYHYPPVPYGIPCRALYSRNIKNLFFAGRNVSCTHMAMSTTRVMATCSVMGQAVGTAAALAIKHRCLPRDICANHIAELQDALQEDDQLIPNRPRKVSALTLQATAQFDELRRGIDRDIEIEGRWGSEPGGTGASSSKFRWHEKLLETGVWLKRGESAEYKWPAPVTLSGARVVFDTELSFRGKYMRRLEATTDYKEMPAMLAREFALEVFKDGNWVEIAREKDNWRRLWRVKFAPVACGAARLKIISAWGAQSDARVFSFEVA